MKEADRRKLTRILGMLGSDHPGERAAAALAAHRQVRALGTTWWDLLGEPPGPRGREVVRTVCEWGVDHQRAAEARARQLKAEIERLRRENARLRQRLELHGVPGRAG